MCVYGGVRLSVFRGRHSVWPSRPVFSHIVCLVFLMNGEHRHQGTFFLQKSFIPFVLSPRCPANPQVKRSGVSLSNLRQSGSEAAGPLSDHQAAGSGVRDTNSQFCEFVASLSLFQVFESKRTKGSNSTAVLHIFLPSISVIHFISFH